MGPKQCRQSTPKRRGSGTHWKGAPLNSKTQSKARNTETTKPATDGRDFFIFIFKILFGVLRFVLLVSEKLKNKNLQISTTDPSEE